MDTSKKIDLTALSARIFSLLFDHISILACKIYGCLGAIFGTCSIMTMVVIGYDRYNVIVKGFSGVKITATKVKWIVKMKSLIRLILPCEGCNDYYWSVDLLHRDLLPSFLGLGRIRRGGTTYHLRIRLSENGKLKKLEELRHF